MEDMPRIQSVAIAGPHQLAIHWKAGSHVHVDLSGWIDAGSEHIAPLKDPDVFETAEVGGDGSYVRWEGRDEIAIDALHLHKIARAQCSDYPPRR